MERVVVRNIARHFDDDLIRLSLYRVFAPFGTVVEVQLLPDCAIVVFKQSESAQAAYVERNGFPMFGRELSVMIGGASIPSLNHFAFSQTPTAALLVQGAETFWLSLQLKRWRGVEECLLVGTQDTLVKCASSDVGVELIKKLHQMRSHSGSLLSAHFVRRLTVSELSQGSL